ncbi:hypothetical protein Adt_03745 [Abeliophyllum distichum]|uniref:Uncharacterized protein n=1 Tax=Abeliophyllum distichum TaxID=126358 RepID=A0ABD1VZM5_9LAMI
MLRTNDDRKTIETTIAQSNPIALQQPDHKSQYSINSIYWEKSNNWGSNRKSDHRQNWSTSSPYRSNVLTKIGQKRCTYYRMTGHIVGTCYFFHSFPPGHTLHGKDVKPRHKCFTNIATASTLDPKE